MQYMQSGCIDDFNCDQTKELKCVNQTCQCVAPKYWNTTTAKCDFVFFGCFFDNTGGGSWFFQAQNIYRRMYYIVDVCTKKITWEVKNGFPGGGNIFLNILYQSLKNEILFFKYFLQ